MDEEKRRAAQENIDPRFGEVRLMWTMPEYHVHERGIWWYVAFVVLGLALIVWALVTANYAFATILVLIGLLLVLDHFRNPENVPVVVLTTGIAVGNHFHEWKEVRDFSLAYNPPEVRKLYVDFLSIRHPILSVDLPEEQDPNEVRQVLKEYAKENLERDSETAADYMKRLYKL